ncbi:MAG: hypothetical protein LBV34_20530 [Nocardiopsaceae bacterium]|nr:hypothetical protein [Nocardiopsaceae bacterium]
MRTAPWSTDMPLFIEDVDGSTRPAAYYLAESRDALYVPYAMRTPSDDGKFPFVFLAYGNGGGGIGWLRDWVHTRPYIMERLLAAGYACGWGRYRTEVDLGFNRGGPLMVDARQGMEVMNRSPLEFEDEVAILEHVRRHPQVDAGNLGHIGVSHAGEMLFKLASRYPGMLRAGVACEPANHEFLDLRLDDIVPVSTETGLRDIEEMQLQDPAWVRARVDLAVARERIAPIDVPILVMGRDGDHLQGIFRLSYELLEEAGKEAEWVTWDHQLHGYIYPPAGEAAPDEIQEQAVDEVIAYLGRYMNPAGITPAVDR